jgi:hypothetical protein
MRVSLMVVEDRHGNIVDRRILLAKCWPDCYAWAEKSVFLLDGLHL